jgi:carotenoid cleavage dioxygenase
MEREAGRALFATSGDPRAHDPGVRGLVTDGVANTNIIHHAGRLLALEEGHAPIAMADEDLGTLGAWDFHGALPGNMTAHPKLDPASGELLFFANLPNGRPDGQIACYAADASGRVERSERLTGPFSALVHDFAVTENFIVVPLCPTTISIDRLRQGGPAIAWEPGLGLRLAVMPRQGGAEDLRWYEGEAAMAWHVVGAHEEGGRIAIDVCAQAAPAFPSADGRPAAEAALTQRLTRWTLDWDGPRRVETRTLHEERCEYPRIDERRTTRPWRHAWVARGGGPGSGDPFHRGLGRFDAVTGVMTRWEAGAGRCVGEPVFAPRPDSEAEGDGWVLTTVFDAADGRSWLAVFDALAIEAGPIVRAFTPHRVPMGFHALWAAA